MVDKVWKGVYPYDFLIWGAILLEKVVIEKKSEEKNVEYSGPLTSTLVPIKAELGKNQGQIEGHSEHTPTC